MTDFAVYDSKYGVSVRRERAAVFVFFNNSSAVIAAVQFSTISGITAFTAEIGAFSVTGDSSGYSYVNNVLTISSGDTYTISMASGVSSTSDNRITVDADGAVELTISGINITSSGDSPLKADGGDLTLILEGNNYLTASGYNYAGLSKTSGDSKLKITSCDGDGETEGSLTAKGEYRAEGIGGGQNTESGSSKASGIIITGGTVTASGYYGIGCGKSNSGTADAPAIDGKIRKGKNSFTTEPVNSGGSSLYLYEITDTAEGEAIYIDGSEYIPNVVHHESNDTSRYLYLPETSETGLVYISIDTAKYYDLSYENSVSNAEYKGTVVLLDADGETLMLDETENVDTSGITVVTDNGSFFGIQVDTEVYGGENGIYLDFAGVSIDGVFYRLKNYHYTDDTEQYAFFPVTRSSTESKESIRVRGAVGTKPAGAGSSGTVYYVTDGTDGLTIKEKSE